MKLLALLFVLSLSGCVVTGQFGYTDPKTGAFVGGTVGHEFADGKTLKPLKGLSK